MYFKNAFKHSQCILKQKLLKMEQCFNLNFQICWYALYSFSKIDFQDSLKLPINDK